MTLKDAFFNPKGDKEIKNEDLVMRENGEKEVPTLHTKTDLFNIGSNINNSAIVGSSVLTMHIDIPAFMTKLDMINDITTNAKRISDFFKSLHAITVAMGDDSKRIAARDKIIAEYKKRKGVKKWLI